MADYALAVDVGAEVTAAISDDEGPRVIPIGDADQLTMPVTVDATGRLLVGNAAASRAGEADLLWWQAQPADSTLAPEDAAEHVVSEAERRVSQRLDGRFAALVVTTPTAFPAGYARGFVDPNSALSYQWTEVLLLATRVASASRSLTYTVTLRRATQQLPRTATFRMIEQSGRSVVCGLVVE
jgi:hypothetical protein